MASVGGRIPPEVSCGARMEDFRPVLLGPAKAVWREAQHPRDNHGRWTDAPGGGLSGKLAAAWHTGNPGVDAGTSHIPLAVRARMAKSGFKMHAVGDLTKVPGIEEDGYGADGMYYDQDPYGDQR